MMDEICFSYTIISFNEKRTIKRCLTAIQENLNINDEVLVIDTGSNDGTVEIIETNFPKVRLVHHNWNNDFADARNFAMSVAKKDWIFFVDCDEVIPKNSGRLIRNHIKKLKKITNRPFVLITKIVNSNSYIDSNSGRILPNNSGFRFFGLVHEFPIYDNNIQCTNYDLIMVKDVLIYHDGYEPAIMKAKNKFERNSNLEKKMLKILPNNIRYNYLYYRDSIDLISDKEYIEGMKRTFEMNTKDKFAIFAAFDLITFYIKEKKFEKADEYIEKVSQSVEEPKYNIMKWQLVYLSSVCEFNKLLIKEDKIVKTLLSVMNNHKSELNEVYLNEANYVDLTGLILLSMGNIKEALKMEERLKKSNYEGQLSPKLIKLEKSLKEYFYEK